MYNLKTVKWENILELLLRVVLLYQAHMPSGFSYLAHSSHLYTTSHSKNNFACTRAGAWTSSSLIAALFLKTLQLEVCVIETF